MSRHTHNSSFYLYLFLMTEKPDEYSAEGRRPACYLEFHSKDRQIRGDSIYEKYAPQFFEVATTRFMDSIKENASRGSSTAEENHPSLIDLTTQFSL